MHYLYYVTYYSLRLLLTIVSSSPRSFSAAVVASGVCANGIGNGRFWIAET